MKVQTCFPSSEFLYDRNETNVAMVYLKNIILKILNKSNAYMYFFFNIFKAIKMIVRLSF